MNPYVPRYVDLHEFQLKIANQDALKIQLKVGEELLQMIFVENVIKSLSIIKFMNNNIMKMAITDIAIYCRLYETSKVLVFSILFCTQNMNFVHEYFANCVFVFDGVDNDGLCGF